MTQKLLINPEIGTIYPQYFPKNVHFLLNCKNIIFVRNLPWPQGVKDSKEGKDLTKMMKPWKIAVISISLFMLTLVIDLLQNDKNEIVLKALPESNKVARTVKARKPIVAIKPTQVEKEEPIIQVAPVPKKSKKRMSKPVKNTPVMTMQDVKEMKADAIRRAKAFNEARENMKQGQTLEQDILTEDDQYQISLAIRNFFSSLQLNNAELLRENVVVYDKSLSNTEEYEKHLKPFKEAQKVSGVEPGDLQKLTGQSFIPKNSSIQFKNTGIRQARWIASLTNEKGDTTSITLYMTNNKNSGWKVNSTRFYINDKNRKNSNESGLYIVGSKSYRRKVSRTVDKRHSF